MAARIKDNSDVELRDAALTCMQILGASIHDGYTKRCISTAATGLHGHGGVPGKFPCANGVNADGVMCDGDPCNPLWIFK